MLRVIITSTILLVLVSLEAERRKRRGAVASRGGDGASFATESEAAEKRMIEAVMGFMRACLGFQCLYSNLFQCL